MNGYYSNYSDFSAAEHCGARRTASRPTPSRSRLDRFLDMVYALLALLAAALRDRTVRRVLRYAVVVGCAICFIGLCGAIEFGTLTVGGGIFGGLVLLFIEIICLK